MPLTPDEERVIQGRVAAAETRTRAQIVAAVIGRCDVYPEIPWKAFALGAALGSLGFVLAELLGPAGWADHAPIRSAVACLCTGAGLALLALVVKPFARLFVDSHRAEAEVRQHAQVLFLRHELFATQLRVGVLLLASEFERQVVVLVDSGVRRLVGETDLGSVVAAMRPALAAGQTAEAFDRGLAALETLLAARGPLPAAGPDEIAERVVQEKGE